MPFRNGKRWTRAESRAVNARNSLFQEKGFRQKKREIERVHVKGPRVVGVQHEQGAQATARKKENKKQGSSADKKRTAHLVLEKAEMFHLYTAIH